MRKDGRQSDRPNVLTDEQQITDISSFKIKGSGAVGLPEVARTQLGFPSGFADDDPQPRRFDGVRTSVAGVVAARLGPRQQLYLLPAGDCQRRCAYMMINLTTVVAAAVGEGGVKEATGRWADGCHNAVGTRNKHTSQQIKFTRVRFFLKH